MPESDGRLRKLRGLYLTSQLRDLEILYLRLRDVGERVALRVREERLEDNRVFLHGVFP